MITVRDLLQVYRNRQAIADAFDVSRQAVSLWGIDQPIPSDREKQFTKEILPSLKKPQPTKEFGNLLQGFWHE